MKEDTKLRDRRIAIVATDGFEERELLEPKQALEAAGAEVEVVSLKLGEIRAWKEQDWGTTIAVDRIIDEADMEDYDALMLPGGVINADKIRADASAIEFVSDMVRAGKPVAVICHGAWVLIETGETAGRRMTSWPSLKTDLENAGAEWVDEEVVVDNGWVSSRKPADIPAFNKKMIEEFCEGRHQNVLGKVLNF
jgi:protease I